MRIRLGLLLTLLSFASSVFGIDRWILISGTVGAFHTDARVFNSSFEKDIVVNARFLQASTGGGNNAAAASVSFTVPKRQMRVMDDVTTGLFNTASLGGIQFTSADEFEVTSRIYAITPAGTVGQFGPGLPTNGAKTKGAVLQMKSSGSRGQTGTFRTNVGALNPNDAAVTVNWVLYDRNSANVGTGTTTMAPFAVIQPLAMTSNVFFQTVTAGVDLSDAWISYTSSSPIFVYASVLDNGTEDQTFVPAVDDKGVPPPPTPTSRTFDVTLQSFSITFAPAPSGLTAGDQVTLRIRNLGGGHGFQVQAPNFQSVVPNTGVLAVGPVLERTFTVTLGNYAYFCTFSTCGGGHGQMTGDFTVGEREPTGGGPGY